MRNLSAALAVLVVILAVVSGNLWRELRAERQLVADLKTQMAAERTVNRAPAPAPVQVQVPVPVPAPVAPTSTAANPAPAPVVQSRESRPTPVLVKPGPAVSTSLPDLVIPPDASEEARRSSAFAQSDSVASGRVLQWRDRLAQAGQTLTADQVVALNAAAIKELRRETEESLTVDSSAGPLDAATVARLREETINRQNETNMRILAAAAPQLTSDIVTALRTQFETGHAARLAAARADRERAASGGN